MDDASVFCVHDDGVDAKLSRNIHDVLLYVGVWHDVLDEQMNGDLLKHLLDLLDDLDKLLE